MEAEKCKIAVGLCDYDIDDLQIAHLTASGIEVVLTTSLYAIIGAIALQKGGDVATKVTRDKILKPMGISQVVQGMDSTGVAYCTIHDIESATINGYRLEPPPSFGYAVIAANGTTSTCV